MGCKKSHSCALFLNGDRYSALLGSSSFPGGDPARQGMAISIFFSIQKSFLFMTAILFTPGVSFSVFYPFIHDSIK